MQSSQGYRAGTRDLIFITSGHEEIYMQKKKYINVTFQERF